jgi:hypothetical protein
MNSWMFYLILAAIPGVIVFAAVYKYLEILQVRRWPSAPGRIVVSTSQAREVSRGDANSNDTELRSFAGIEYEYTVAGRTYRGTRVSIGENMGNFEVAETIARFGHRKTDANEPGAIIGPHRFNRIDWASPGMVVAHQTIS